MNSLTVLPSSKEIKIYNNACKKVNDIISNYGSIEYLKSIRNQFRKQKTNLDPYLKSASLAYRTYNYNNKQIKSFVSKYRNTNNEDTSISVAQDEYLSISQNSINHDNCNCSSSNQPYFDNLKHQFHTITIQKFFDKKKSITKVMMFNQF